MSDLIKRQDAIDALNDCEDIKGFGYTQMHDAIMEIPSVEPKRGEWIYTNNPLRLDDEWACSRCGNISFVRTNYCDRCGCKMRGENDG